MEIKKRCNWGNTTGLMQTYHDAEWGVPVHDDRLLFEMLVLDSFQAGLSWSTILNKRESFRKAFDNFEHDIIALYTDEKVEELLQNEGIVRSRSKINGVIGNAKIVLQIQREFGSFDSYLWAFTDGKTIVNRDNNISPKTELSDRISKDLKKRSMKYTGSVIIYAFLQTIGIVNDHHTECFRYNELIVEENIV